VNIKQIQQVLRKRGWCQAYSDGYFYNTVGNESPAGIDREIEQGWELVGIFTWDKNVSLITNPSAKRNLTVFRKPAPAFFTAENPWTEKGPLPWLPDLTLGTADDLARDLSKAGGHGSPGIARRFRCSCGEQSVICLYDEENAKAEAECPSCKKRTLVCDVQQQDEPLECYCCQCGEENVVIDLGIEYPVDAEGGWNFSWITVAVTCCSCGEVAFLFNDETA
jgi:hypothetical protein